MNLINDIGRFDAHAKKIDKNEYQIVLGAFMKINEGINNYQM